MKKLVLVYFAGCPNYIPAKELLEEAGYDFSVVCQDQLDSDHELKGYSSPTLLHGNKIIFGSKAKGGGCSLALPTAQELKQELESKVSQV